MLEMILGTDGKRKLRLRHKTNSELFTLYDSHLILKHRSQEALEEARRVLGHFKAYLGEFPPSPELAVGFLAQFKDRKPTTLYRYDSILKGFMAWYGEKLAACPSNACVIGNQGRGKFGGIHFHSHQGV